MIIFTLSEHSWKWIDSTLMVLPSTYEYEFSGKWKTDFYVLKSDLIFPSGKISVYTIDSLKFKVLTSEKTKQFLLFSFKFFHLKASSNSASLGVLLPL